MFEKKGKFLLFDLPAFAEWLREYKPHRVVRYLQNHHTWKPSYANFNGKNHFAKLAGMETSHLQRGFAEIGQNLTTFPDGLVAVCRSLDKQPAGIKGANRHALCIENLGNFDVGGDVMTAAQRETIVKLNALLCHKYLLHPDTKSIVYHHWFAAKTCPGTNFFHGNTEQDAEKYFIPLVQRELDTLVAAEPPSPVVCSGKVTADSLNVRSGPGSSYAVLDRLLTGAPVNGYAVESNWWRIHPTQSRWVYGRYVQ